MKYYYLVLCVVINVPAEENVPEPTLSVHNRVNLLKRQIEEQIQLKKSSSDAILPIDSYDYQYVELDDGPITPILHSDKRKRDGKFKLKEIKTTTKMTTKEVKQTSKHQSAILKSRVVKKGKRKHRPPLIKPVDTFYRRMFGSPDVPLEWLHCQDLVTPYYAGLKSEVTEVKRLTSTDHKVWRLIQLLQVNTTSLNKDEIYSILYQINNVQIRLFQWDSSAIALLLKTLSDRRPLDFQSVTHGVRHLLGHWGLDISNTTTLLKEARIFRPPCIRVSDYEGSTKTSHGFIYPKTTAAAKSTCAVPGADCDN